MRGHEGAEVRVWRSEDNLPECVLRFELRFSGTTVLSPTVILPTLLKNKPKACIYLFFCGKPKHVMWRSEDRLKSVFSFYVMWALGTELRSSTQQQSPLPAELPPGTTGVHRHTCFTFLQLFVCLSVWVCSCVLVCARECTYMRSEDNLQELVLFYHVGSWQVPLCAELSLTFSPFFFF